MNVSHVDAAASLDLHVSDDEISATLKPFVTATYGADSPEWRAETARLDRQMWSARLRHAFSKWLPGRRRSQSSVDYNYDQQWKGRPIEQQVGVDGPAVLCQWREQRMRARAVMTKRVHQLFLMRVIDHLRPRRVLEVGCGNGLNLFVLAGRFPEIAFTGLELTAGGAAACARVRRLPEVPAEIQGFSPEPVREPSAGRRIAFVRGDAGALPFVSDHFDLVFTSLALEQMEPIRERALRELRRVSAAHVAMVEPFREWNAEGPSRNFVVSNDYFAGRISDLPQLGLQPVFVTNDMPAKLLNRTGLVVCRVL
jgi:SAM-dependent methyltransferase